MPPRGSSAISPTALYTGEVWRRNGLSDPALATREGRLLHAALRPAMAVSRLAGGPTLDPFLLARHRLIDRELERAVSTGAVGQVVEIAAGLSPRGLRFSRRHPDLAYVEADLAGMVERKRSALSRAGAPGGLVVVEVDALREGGPGSLDDLAAQLDPAAGAAVVTEGLLSYLPREAVNGLWRRIGRVLRAFPAGIYLSDLHLADREHRGASRAFRAGLSVFVRGRVGFPFSSEPDVREELDRAGFARGRLISGAEAGGQKGAGLVDVLVAETAGAQGGA